MLVFAVGCRNDEITAGSSLLGIISHGRWTRMVEVKQLTLVDHLGSTRLILIQELNVVNNMVTLYGDR